MPVYRCHFCNKLRTHDQFEFEDLNHKHFVCVACKNTIKYQSDKLEQEPELLDIDRINDELDELGITNREEDEAD